MNATPSTPLAVFCTDCYANRGGGGKPPGPHLLASQMLVINHLQRILDRQPVLADLSAELLQRLIHHLESIGLSPDTVTVVHNTLLTLWRCVADCGIVPIDAAYRSKLFRHRELDGGLQQLDAESPGTLWHYCVTELFRKNIRIRSEETKRQYRYAFGDFKAFLGREPMLDDLTDDNLVLLLKSLAERLSAKTANERVGRLRCLWNWRAKRDRSIPFPTIQKMKVPKRIPRAWTRDQLDKLLDACQRMPGNIGSVSIADWWTGIHLVIWDCSERIGAVLAIRWEWLDWDTGDLLIPAEARKSMERDMAYRLNPETLVVLRRLQASGSDLVFPWPYRGRGGIYDHYKALLTLAGLPHEKWKSAFHKIRKSVASHLAAAGYDASIALGHSSPQVTRDSYLDPRIVSSARPSEVLFRPGTPQTDPFTVEAVGFTVSAATCDVPPVLNLPGPVSSPVTPPTRRGRPARETLGSMLSPDQLPPLDSVPCIVLDDEPHEPFVPRPRAKRLAVSQPQPINPTPELPDVAALAELAWL